MVGLIINIHFLFFLIIKNIILNFVSLVYWAMLFNTAPATTTRSICIKIYITQYCPLETDWGLLNETSGSLSLATT